MDSSIYGALVRLAQPWVMRYPLIDFHGSMGNRDGDGPAAYRYTEARLAKITEDGLLCGIKKKNVDFIPNYSETKDEPLTLPSLFPNLLCNPNTGIGVAVASNWLPHNLREVANAIYDYMDGKEPSIPGPDFPTGGLVINAKEIPNIIKTGHGSVKIRGKYKIEDNNIVFYEIPYGVITENLMNEIGAASDQGKISGIKNIRNESNRKSGFRLVIECDKNSSINTIVNLLFKETNLQTSISYNQVALVNKTPTELGLKDCIKIYIDHNIDCIVRETNFDLDKAKNKLEIINGLLKALEDIDNIIALIKKSESSNAARISLQEKYNFTEAQSKAIVDMKLGKLAGLERIELQNEAKELEDLINSLMNILKDPLSELRKRLVEFVKIYGDDRRTELTQLSIDKEDKEIEFVEPEKCVVVMTEGGTIKRIPSTSFRVQRRNGKGVRTQEDITSVIIRTNTIDSLMIFTNKGKMYRLLVDNIPIGTNSSKGTPIKSLISMDEDENPETIYSIYRDTDAKYVLFTTKNGLVKKTSLDEYINTRKKTGIDAISLRDGDSISSVSLIKDEPLIFITANGKMLKCSSSSIGISSRKTQGVRAMNLDENDYIIATLPLRDSSDCVAIFSERGCGKRIPQSEILSQNKGGKGLVCYKGEDKVSAAALVSENDLILICGNKSSICIKANELPITNRTSIGNQIIKNSNIKSVSKV